MMKNKQVGKSEKMKKYEIEKIVLEILENEDSGFGMMSRQISEKLPSDDVKLNPYEVGKICKNSENIEKINENSTGARWSNKDDK